MLCQEDGRPLTTMMARYLVERAARRAGLTKHGVHILRHSFCSHLAMRRAPFRAIQELAGHGSLSVTSRYMHLTPSAVEGAIRLLEQPAPTSSRGAILETGSADHGKSKR